MDYEKKYKEALGRAKNLHKDAIDMEENSRAKLCEIIFPELVESEDEKTRKEIRNFIWNYPNKFIERDKWLAWLERQSEKPRYNIGDVLCDKSCTTLNKDAQPNFEIIDIRNGMYICDKGSFPIYQQDEFELVAKRIEQKPTNNIEPKFKVGDWVVFNNRHDSIYQVEKIENYEYTLKHFLGGSMPLSFSHEDMIREWTIQDAKDGYVLACDKEILLFKSYSEGCISLYCWYNGHTNNFHSQGVVDTVTSTRNRICPATKEQRETLFAKMKEAGYRWDEEKKELRKIEEKPVDEVKTVSYSHLTPNPEFFQWIYDRLKYVYNENPNIDYMRSLRERIEDMQKPTEWSKEDERIRQCLIRDQEKALDDVRNDKYGHSEIISDLKEMYRERIDWLKSLKDRVGYEANCTTTKEWSERDKEEFQIAIDTLVDAGQRDSAHWLESLKQRMGWKPTEKQMVALEYYMYALSATEHKEVLFGLYNDLKKLREE